jgi:hypothetical protein
MIINRLLASFPPGHSGDGKTALESYIIGLSDLPIEHVKTATVQFLRGNVAGHNPAFAPSPPQIAIEARRLEQEEIAKSLVVLKSDHPDFKAVEKARGKPLVVGRSGTTTITKSEIEQARRALA